MEPFQIWAKIQGTSCSLNMDHNLYPFKNVKELINVDYVVVKNE
jgi:hypothetical protein